MKYFFLLSLLIILKCENLSFYFYLDDSIRYIIIDETIIYFANDVFYEDKFHYITSEHQIDPQINKKITIILYNKDGPWGINGFIKIGEFRYFTNNTRFYCLNCLNYTTNFPRIDTNGIEYNGYDGYTETREYFEFIFNIPKILKENADDYGILYYTKNNTFRIYRNSKIEINSLDYFSNIIFSDTINKPYYQDNYLFIYLEYNFKGRFKIKNGEEVTNYYYSNTNFVYTFDNNVDETFTSQIRFYSWDNIKNIPTSTIGFWTFHFCEENCQECNIISNLISCSYCKNGYAFVNNNKQKCVDESTLVQKYYKMDSQNYYSCYESCLTCNTNGDVNNHNCTSCPKHYITISESNFNCFDECPTEYPFKNGNECLNSCKLHNLFYQNGNCINECSLYKKIIINSKEEDECIESCDKNIIQGDPKECVVDCFSNNLNISYDGIYCIDECIGEYPYIQNGQCVNYCNNNYYHIKDVYLCIPECPNSHSFIIEDGKICVDNCNDKYQYNKDNKKYCIDNCNDKYEYIHENKKYCLDECNSDKYEYIDENKKYCLDNCYSNTFEYIHENKKYCLDDCNSDTFEYIHDNKKYCLDDCYLKNTIPDKKGKICYKNCVDNTINENNIELNDECTNKCLPLMKIVNSKCVPLYNEIDNKLYCNSYEGLTIEKILNMENILSFKDSGKTIFGDGFNIQIYESDNPINEIIDSSVLNINQCEEILRKKYNIKDDEKLIIVKIDTYEQKTKENYNVNFHFYYNGEKLNNLYCNNVNYYVNIPKNNKINFSNASNIYNKYGIDIYNINDDYFNDICKNINDGNNILLKERKKYYYQNEELCVNNCRYTKMNYENGKSNCNCNSNYNMEKNNKTIIEIFFYKRGFENLIIFKCYKELKLSNKLFYNIGFDLLLSIILIQTLFLILKLKSELIQFNTKLNNMTENNQKTLATTEFNKKTQLSSFFFKHKSKFSQNLNTLPFKLAIINDKRTFIKIFLDLITIKTPFLNIFYKHNNFQLFSLDLNIELCSFAFLYTINTLLYNDRMISHKYIIGNQIDYLFLIINSFRVYFVIFLYNIIKYSFNYTKHFDLLFSENDNSLNYLFLIKKSLKNLRLKIFIYIFVQYVCCILIWYYVTIFCFIYNNNQIDWFIQGLFTTTILFLNILIFSLIISITRKFSLIIHSIKIYNISLFLYNLKLY